MLIICQPRHLVKSFAVIVEINEMKWNEMKWNEMKWNEIISERLWKLPIFSGGSTGGGLGGLNPPPPPLGLPSKNLMCIEKRHHYVQTHTVCSYSTLSQAQPQTIGFKPPPPPPQVGLPSEHVMCIEKRHHVVSRCQENITYGGSK